MRKESIKHSLVVVFSLSLIGACAPKSDTFDRESGDLATKTYTSAWTHTDGTSGIVLAERLVSQTTWVRQADGSWKNVSDLNAVYPVTE